MAREGTETKALITAARMAKLNDASGASEAVSTDASKIDRDLKVRRSHEVIHRSREQTEQQLNRQRLLAALMDQDVSHNFAERAVKGFSSSAGVLSRDEIGTIALAIKSTLLAVAEKPPTPLPTDYERYVGNRGGSKSGESIVEFLRRVWKPWIENGVMTRPELRRLDPAAYMALSNWLRSNALPPDLPLLSKSQMVDRRLAEYRSRGEVPVNLDRTIRARLQRGR